MSHSDDASLPNPSLSHCFTVAVFSDVHGNDDALDAVLADLSRHRYDALVVAGDLAIGGPHPAACIARIRALDATVIHGNGEREMVTARSGDYGWWWREQIGPENLAYLDALPFSHRITPPDGVSPDDDLLIVHATPTSVTAVLVSEPHPMLPPVTPEDEATALIGDARANLILSAHIHTATAGRVRGQRLATIGSVGYPSDGDPRAAYGLVHWDGEAWRVEHRRVVYDREPVIRAITESGQTLADLHVRRLRESRFIPPAG
jgi:diadenosine tetraphosphatase ApaH/serine/threonine PP2A family protein phosphatase